MRHKRPAALNIGIDRDPAAVRAAAAIAGNGGARFLFEVGDALGFLAGYPFAGDELVYCDPPYLFETRSAGRGIYDYELGDDRHPALLDILAGLPCMAMVSGYWSELYATRLAGWQATSFPAMTRGGRQATEWLWCNFPPPVALHDYRHLGASFRERERIRRKKQRWTERLHRLPALERQALLAAMQEAGLLELASPGTAMQAFTAGSGDGGRHRQERRGRARTPGNGDAAGEGARKPAERRARSAAVLSASAV
jgi:DNA adenine methylase